MAPTATIPRPTVDSLDEPGQPRDVAVRIVNQAIRTLVPDAGLVTLTDLTSVTRLDPAEACATANRLVRAGPIAVSRYATDGKPAWHVRRTDR